MRKLGVPYQQGYESIAVDDLNAQAQQISKRLNEELGIEVLPELEIVALISYLQRLGVDIKGNPTASISELTPERRITMFKHYFELIENVSVWPVNIISNIFWVFSDPHTVAV